MYNYYDIQRKLKIKNKISFEYSKWYTVVTDGIMEDNFSFVDRVS